MRHITRPGQTLSNKSIPLGPSSTSIHLFTQVDENEDADDGFCQKAAKQVLLLVILPTNTPTRDSSPCTTSIQSTSSLLCMDLHCLCSFCVLKQCEMCVPVSINNLSPSPFALKSTHSFIGNSPALSIEASVNSRHSGGHWVSATEGGWWGDVNAENSGREPQPKSLLDSAIDIHMMLVKRAENGAIDASTPPIDKVGEFLVVANYRPHRTHTPTPTEPPTVTVNWLIPGELWGQGP